MQYQCASGLSDDSILFVLKDTIKGKNLKKILLLPPDYTRMYSGAGKIVAMYWELLHETCQIDIMPALGTHAPMTEEECKAFFGENVPFENIIVHRWRDDVVKIGEVPGEYVSEVSEGLVNTPIDVEVNKRLLDPSYDLIISIGQVVPHEVVGMANYSKNLFVGCGGSSMINSSHMLGAFYGMERIMGKDFSPVRKVFDYAQENFCKDMPLLFVLTCTTNTGDQTNIHGIYTGRDRANFEKAVAHSQQINLIHVDKPFQKVVVYLDPREFKSTWLGNKAVYRTRSCRTCIYDIEKNCRKENLEDFRNLFVINAFAVIDVVEAFAIFWNKLKAALCHTVAEKGDCRARICCILRPFCYLFNYFHSIISPKNSSASHS